MLNCTVNALCRSPAQVYMVPKSLPTQPESRLLKQLVGYERMHLAAGASTDVTFEVSTALLRVVDKESGAIVSAPGTFELAFTNGVAATVSSGTLTVNGASDVVVTPFPY
jgi:hypothetical protein